MLENLTLKTRAKLQKQSGCSSMYVRKTHHKSIFIDTCHNHCGVFLFIFSFSLPLLLLNVFISYLILTLTYLQFCLLIDINGFNNFLAFKHMLVLIF